jgi:integrase
MTIHRANREGTIYQRQDGRWVAAWTEDGPDGRLRRRSAYSRSQPDAKRVLREALRRLDAGQPGQDSTVTFASFSAASVSTTLPAADVKATTRHIDEAALRLWLLPRLGARQLKRLRPSDIEAVLVALAKEGKSAQTRRTAYTVVRKVLDAAARDGELARNPAAAVPRPRTEPTASRFLDRDTVRALLECARGDRLEPLVTLLAYTGLRIGEALALRWDDVDLDVGFLRVTGTMARADGKITRPSTNSARSRRAVALPGPALEALKARRTSQPRERLAATAGAPSATFHGLRHSAATVLLEEGVPMRVVAEILGHSSTRLIADTYSHVAARLTQEAAAALTRGLA